VFKFDYLLNYYKEKNKNDIHIKGGEMGEPYSGTFGEGINVFEEDVFKDR
tara:strand:+ start:307 stop:456 length:150 start_codon:yes stop_codon:yes gene_type:complete